MRFRDEPILSAKGETDSYSFSTAYTIQLLHPQAKAIYRHMFKTPVDLPKGFPEALREQIDSLAYLTTTPGLPEWYKRQVPWIPGEFIDDFFNNFQFNPDEVHVEMVNGQLAIWTDMIPFSRAIHWPYRIMPLINELRNRMLGIEPDRGWAKILADKWRIWRQYGVPVAEFGLRRRAYGWMHDIVVETAKEVGGSVKDGGIFLGTSDVELAFKYDVKSMGTQDHAYTQYEAAVHGYALANKFAMSDWRTAYPKQPGYVLTDTYTNEVFLRDFDLDNAMAFTGVRPDSEDPFDNTDLFDARYVKLGINRNTKGIIHSNGLSDVWTPIQLHEYAKGRLIMSAGIGTFNTNDVAYFTHTLGYIALDHVMKAVEFEFPDPTDPTGRRIIRRKSCKISRDKATGDPAEIARAKAELEIR